MFALVALVSVGLTTFFTLGAVFSAQHELFRGGPPFSGQDFTSARAAFRRVAHTAFFAALLSVGLAVIMAAIATRLLTRPLIALTEGARRLEAGERDLRLRVPGARDELRELTEAFNNLVAGLERQEAWRRGMVADIAHDLRTPLAVLRSEIEAMQDGLATLDGAALTRLHGEVMMLSRLVNDLRTLSLAESGGLSLQPQPTEIAPLLQRVLESFTSRAAQAGVTLHLEPVPAGLSAELDPDRISQLLGNLLDNALRYAAPGEVELGAAEEEEGVRVWLRDHGPGLPPETTEHVFERFYRGDSARTRQPPGADARADEGGGSGLGLAIAQAIAVAHGGRLEAANCDRRRPKEAPVGKAPGDDQGALFTLHLPADGAHD